MHMQEWCSVICVDDTGHCYSLTRTSFFDASCDRATNRNHAAGMFDSMIAATLITQGVSTFNMIQAPRNAFCMSHLLTDHL